MSDRPLKAALAGFALAQTLFAASGPRRRTPAAPPRRAVVAEPPPVTTRRLFGIAVADLTRADVVERILAWAGRPPARIVVTTNLDHVMKLRADPAFRAVYERADLVTADGMPFVWLSRREGRPLAERVAGADLVVPVAQGAARAGRSVFLFGTTADRVAAAALALKRVAPGLAVAGTLAPPFGFERDEALFAEHVAVLRAARPDIVMVALGAPKQEIWSARMADALGTGVFLNIGAGLDFLAGDVRRAPRLAQVAALEWAWRALSEPRRLGPRYARIVAALPSLYALHERDLAETEARRLRAAMAAETEAALARRSGRADSAPGPSGVRR